jgi:hypothetical protein
MDEEASNDPWMLEREATAISLGARMIIALLSQHDDEPHAVDMHNVKRLLVCVVSATRPGL